MPWVKAREAAAHLQCSVRNLSHMARAGRLEARRTTHGHHEYLISGATESPSAPLEAATPIGDDRDALETLAARVRHEPAREPARAEAGGAELGCWVSDVHVPDHDVRATSAWLDWLEHAQPGCVVLGGDIAELESCSQHGGIAQPASLLEDCEAVEGFLRGVRKRAADAEIVYIGGNHEDRLRRIAVAQAPTLSGAMDLPSLLRLDEIGISYVPYPSSYDRADIRFFHGRYHCIHHAKKHLEDEHHQHRHVVYGHTHRPQTYTVGLRGGRTVTAWGAGCLRTLEPQWRLGKAGWAHGFITWETVEGESTLSQVLMSDRRFVWRGRRFG